MSPLATTAAAGAQALGVRSASAINASWMRRSISIPSRVSRARSRYARSPGMRISSTPACRGVALIDGDLRRQRATIVFERNEQIGLERDEEVAGASPRWAPSTQHAERVHRERQRVAFVPAERQDRAASRGLRVRRGTAVRVDRHALRQRDAEPLAELEIRAHERGGAQIDHQRIALHREAEGDRIGAEGCFRAAQRRHHRRGGHGVDRDQAGARHHLDVVGAAAAHPDVVDAGEREAVGVGALDHGAGRVVHAQHAALVAAVEQHRHARFLDDAHRAAPILARVVGDVEQLRQARVLVAAQGRVDHVVGEDTSLLGLVADSAHGALGQRPGLGDAQMDAFGGIGRHARLRSPA